MPLLPRLRNAAWQSDVVNYSRFLIIPPSRYMKILPSLRRAKGMTLLELTVVILVLLALVSITFVGARTWKKGSDRAGCIMNLRKTQQAVRAYQNTHQLADYTPFDMATELMGPGKYLEVEPRCPSGGNYNQATTIPGPGEMVMTCSLASGESHEIADFVGW